MEFNRIIKLLRKERGITQKQAAEDLGVSQALLSHYEKGIRECGLDFVVRVADYYNVSCDYLLGRSAEMRTNFRQIDVHEFAELFGGVFGNAHHGGFDGGVDDGGQVVQTEDHVLARHGHGVAVCRLQDVVGDRKSVV